MSDEKFALVINLSKLAAVRDYLRERGDERVSTVLDGIIDGFQDALSNLK